MPGRVSASFPVKPGRTRIRSATSSREGRQPPPEVGVLDQADGGSGAGGPGTAQRWAADCHCFSPSPSAPSGVVCGPVSDSDSVSVPSAVTCSSIGPEVGELLGVGLVVEPRSRPDRGGSRGSTGRCASSRSLVDRLGEVRREAFSSSRCRRRAFLLAVNQADEDLAASLAYAWRGHRFLWSAARPGVFAITRP